VQVQEGRALAMVPEARLDARVSRAESTKTGERIELDHRARMDARATVTRCVCGWTHSGTAGEGREAARAHRAKEHPELPLKARRPRRVFRGTLDGGGERLSDQFSYNPRVILDPEGQAAAEILAAQRRAAGLAVEARENAA
jgi:hypothetical protein